MKKKLSILLLLVILPQVVGYWYDKTFRFSGGFFEEYQNYFKVGLLLLSILSTGWIIYLSKKDKSWVWMYFAILFLLALLIYLYFALVIINWSIGF